MKPHLLLTTSALPLALASPARAVFVIEDFSTGSANVARSAAPGGQFTTRARAANLPSRLGQRRGTPLSTASTASKASLQPPAGAA